MENSLDGPLVIFVAAWLSLVVSIALSRSLAYARVLVDRPNHRSSHSRETSKAGGVALMGSWFAGMFMIGAFSGDSSTAGVALSLILCGGGAFLIGLLDDRFGLSPLPKFAGQILAGWLFVTLFSSLHSLPIPMVGAFEGGWIGTAVSLFWIMAFMNAYNFMDGANGLAGTSAALGVVVFSAIAALYGQVFLAAAALLYSGALLGFLPSNLRYGKLFMGDSGSQLTAFLIAILGILGANWTGGRISAFFMPMVFAAFIFDVTFTLAHRIIRKQRILEGHREHLYQLLIRMGAPHVHVAALYAAMTGVCSAAAILMLLIPVGWQWLVPFAAICVMMIGAVGLFARAKNAGLFDDQNEGPAPSLTVSTEGDLMR